MPKHLPHQEWIILTLLLLIMATLVFITWRPNDSPPTQPIHLFSQEISVTISGAISNPGVYTFENGANLQELLNKAELLPEANLKGINPQKILKNGQRINIPTKPMITVFIEGAVENPRTLTVPKGTKVCELQDAVKVLPEGDSKKLQAKRRLKDQESIHIPIRKKKQNKKPL